MESLTLTMFMSIVYSLFDTDSLQLTPLVSYSFLFLRIFTRYRSCIFHSRIFSAPPWPVPFKWLSPLCSCFWFSQFFLYFRTVCVCALVIRRQARQLTAVPASCHKPRVIPTLNVSDCVHHERFISSTLYFRRIAKYLSSFRSVGLTVRDFTVNCDYWDSLHFGSTNAKNILVE